jgi:hypothetical protein
MRSSFVAALAVLAVTAPIAAGCTTPEPQPQKTSSAAAASARSPAPSASTVTAPTAAPTDAPAPDPKPALDALRAGLEKVRATKGKDVFEVKDVPKVDALVGQSRDTIETALGKPTVCTGKAQPSAPCQSADDVFYSLYKLADGARGGGPELLLTYDEDAFCTRAELAQTR